MDASLKKSKDWTPFRDDRFPPKGVETRKVGKTASALGRFKLCTNYETMFSDTRPRNWMKAIAPRRPPSSSQPGKLRLKAVEDMKTLMEVQGSHRTLFYRQPSKKHFSSYSTVIVNLEGSSKKVSFGSESDPSTLEAAIRKEKSAMVITLPVKSEKMATKETQTDYRESEAQTLPWKHEIKAEGKILKELLSLEWFTPERNFPPGVEEVTLIERARQKLAWENVVQGLRGKENESKRKCLVVRMAATETAFRERKIDEENRERIEISKRQMKEALERFERKLLLRLQKSYGSRKTENDSKIHYWNHQLTRKIRKMKSAREEERKKSGRSDIISIHQDKTSELYAPKLRDGENPSLGHEVIDIQCRYLKRFHGLNILEKYLTRVLQPKVLGFDFEEASRPKIPELCLRKFRERVVNEPEEEKFLESLQLKIPVPVPSPEPQPPDRPSDSEENLFQASLLLTRLIRGRAVQTSKFLERYKMASE